MSSDRKLVFILPRTTEFGGLERHILELLERLREPNLQFLIVCFGQDIISARMDGNQRARVTVQCREEPESLADWFRLIRENRPSIIVFCYSWIGSFPWLAPVAAQLAGVKKRFSIQHLIPSLVPPPIEGWSLVSIVRRLVGRRTRYLACAFVSGRAFNNTICVSDAVRNALVNELRFPPGKTITIRNGVSTSAFFPSNKDGAVVRSRLGIGPDEFLLVCIARLASAKGVDILLQAVSQVIHQGISCKCIIVGDGPLKEALLEQSYSLGLKDIVFFEGFQKNVVPYLQAGSAFILTSHLEGLPFSVLEAMACGMPCIVTNVGGTAEVVAHQIVGLVIPPASVEAAAEAISYLAAHPEERAEMAGRTRDTVFRAFDIESQMGKLAQLLLH
jgi:glycosyltransferase involved in cell wall biosynthesis